jgi:hypothetical protein
VELREINLCKMKHMRGVVPEIDSKAQRIMSGIKVLNEMFL